MSQVNIRQALETALNAIIPAIPIAWENNIYTPVDGEAYCAAYLLGGPPANKEIGVNSLAQETGIFQVNLMYPANQGPGLADAQAEVLKATFFVGATFTKGTTKVTVAKTPTVAQGRPDGDRWMVPVKITYQTNGL